MSRNRMVTVLVVSVALTVAILAWGLYSYPRFHDVKPHMAASTSVVELPDYSGTRMEAVSGRSNVSTATSARRAGGTGTENASSANRSFDGNEFFRIIGTSEGDTGKVWFLKGKSSGIVVAAGEQGNSNFTYIISKNRDVLTDGKMSYRIERE